MRNGEGGRITPGVIIESKEITTFISGPTVHVFGHLETVRVDICSRVSHRDLAVSTACDVLSHIPRNGLDVWCSASGVVIIDNLVAGEKGESVCVVGKCVDGSKDVLEVVGVVGDRRLVSTKGEQWSVDVENEVDASSCQRAHTSIVIDRVVNTVDSNGIDTQLLEIRDISRAAHRVRDRVTELRRTAGLIINTANVEAFVPLEEC